LVWPKLLTGSGIPEGREPTKKVQVADKVQIPPDPPLISPAAARTEGLPVSKTLKKRLAFMIGNVKRKGYVHREVCYGDVKDRKTVSGSISVRKSSRHPRGRALKIASLSRLRIEFVPGGTN